MLRSSGELDRRVEILSCKGSRRWPSLFGHMWSVWNVGYMLCRYVYQSDDLNNLTCADTTILIRDYLPISFSGRERSRIGGPMEVSTLLAGVIAE